MNCRQAEPLLARAADGTLDADRGAALVLHLADCADCREALDAQRTMRVLLVERPAAPVPVGFRHARDGQPAGYESGARSRGRRGGSRPRQPDGSTQ